MPGLRAPSPLVSVAAGVWCTVVQGLGIRILGLCRLLSILTHRVAVARVLISGGGGNIMPDFLSTFVNK